MISRKTFNHQLNEEILTMKLNTNEQILKKALMGACLKSKRLK